MWCVPKLDEQYIERMEDVLEVLSKPQNEREPLVVLDERPVQLRGSARPGAPLAPGKVARKDYEYVRCGTANIFCVAEPKVGRHHTHATPDRTAPRFANAMKRIAEAHPRVKTIHAVMDNLNTHCEKSLTDAFGLRQGRTLWRQSGLSVDGEYQPPAEAEGRRTALAKLQTSVVEGAQSQW